MATVLASTLDAVLHEDIITMTLTAISTSDTLGAELREMRTQAGLTPIEVAIRGGLDVDSVHQVEAHGSYAPLADIVRFLCAVTP